MDSYPLFTGDSDLRDTAGDEVLGDLEIWRLGLAGCSYSSEGVIRGVEWRKHSEAGDVGRIGMLFWDSNLNHYLAVRCMKYYNVVEWSHFCQGRTKSH